MALSNSLQFDDELMRRIDDLARANGVTPAEIVREAVETFAAAQNGGNGNSARTTDDEAPWDIALRIGESIPIDEWAKLPRDLASQFDHYCYGHPKRED